MLVGGLRGRGSDVHPLCRDGQQQGREITEILQFGEEFGGSRVIGFVTVSVTARREFGCSPVDRPLSWK